ncbi:MAG: DUF7487 domain-containing protein [Nanoarchaeota archaeon]
MKDLNTDIDGKYLCEECGSSFIKKRSLATHIQLKHDKYKYYLSFLYDKKDDECLLCGKKTKFISAIRGFENFCCKEHRFKHSSKKRKENLLKQYGVEYNWQRDDVKEKIKQSHIKKFGGIGFAVEKLREKTLDTIEKKYGKRNYLNIEKSKNTRKKRYGDENYTNREKAHKTNLEKYGNKSPLWGVEQIKKKKKTWLEKYGVENPLQNKEVLDKNLKSRRKIKKFNSSGLTYQGSYELDFLEKFYDKIDVENAPSIPYIFENKNKVYHPDFYIPSKNLIIEIKSTYILKLDKEIKYKEKACLNNGYEYMLILEKNYSDFKKILI